MSKVIGLIATTALVGGIGFSGIWAYQANQIESQATLRITELEEKLNQGIAEQIEKSAKKGIKAEGFVDIGEVSVSGFPFQHVINIMGAQSEFYETDENGLKEGVRLNMEGALQIGSHTGSGQHENYFSVTMPPSIELKIDQKEQKQHLLTEYSGDKSNITKIGFVNPPTYYMENRELFEKLFNEASKAEQEAALKTLMHDFRFFESSLSGLTVKDVNSDQAIMTLGHSFMKFFVTPPEQDHEGQSDGATTTAKSQASVEKGLYEIGVTYQINDYTLANNYFSYLQGTLPNSLSNKEQKDLNIYFKALDAYNAKTGKSDIEIDLLYNGPLEKPANLPFSPAPANLTVHNISFGNDVYQLSATADVQKVLGSIKPNINAEIKLVNPVDTVRLYVELFKDLKAAHPAAQQRLGMLEAIGEPQYKALKTFLDDLKVMNEETMVIKVTQDDKGNPLINGKPIPLFLQEAQQAAEPLLLSLQGE